MVSNVIITFGHKGDFIWKIKFEDTFTYNIDVLKNRILNWSKSPLDQTTSLPTGEFGFELRSIDLQSRAYWSSEYSENFTIFTIKFFTSYTVNYDIPKIFQEVMPKMR